MLLSEGADYYIRTSVCESLLPPKQIVRNLGHNDIVSLKSEHSKPFIEE